MLISHVIAIGMILSFLFTELTGLSAGGMIVPGYLAFYLTSPQRLLATFLAALVAYLLVRLLGNVLIVFGRRRFMLAVLFGYLAGWGLSLLPAFLAFDGDARAIGYVLPGLIANDMLRQGVIKTTLAVLVVTIIVRLVLLFLI